MDYINAQKRRESEPVVPPMIAVSDALALIHRALAMRCYGDKPEMWDQVWEDIEDAARRLGEALGVGSEVAVAVPALPAPEPPPQCATCGDKRVIATDIGNCPDCAGGPRVAPEHAVFYLIEDPQRPGDVARWWSGMRLNFTPNANDAVRFPCRKNAEEFKAAYFETLPHLIVSEHVWPLERGAALPAEHAPPPDTYDPRNPNDPRNWALTDAALIGAFRRVRSALRELANPRPGILALDDIELHIEALQAWRGSRPALAGSLDLEPTEAQIDAAESWYYGDAHPPERKFMRPFIRGMARAILNAGRAGVSENQETPKP